MRDSSPLSGQVRVLIVSSSAEHRRWVRAAFGAEPLLECLIAECDQLEAALARLEHDSFDVVLLDTTPADVSRISRAGKGAAVFFLAWSKDAPPADEVLAAGASDYISPPETGMDPNDLWVSLRQGLRFHRMQRERSYFAEVIRERDRQLVQLTQRLAHASPFDQRTGWPRHQYIVDRLGEECRRSTRYKLPLTAVLMDVLGLDGIQRDHGTAAANGVIGELAERVRIVARKTDLVGHYGTDGFLVLLTNTDREGGYIFCQRTVQAIAPPVAIEEKQFQLQCYFGLAEYGGDHSSNEKALLELISNRLDQAKEAGQPSTIVGD